MARLRRAAFADCPDRQEELRAALAAVDAASGDAELSAACGRVRDVIGECSAPEGTSCYAHKVARMTVYRHRPASQAKASALSAALGRLPLWPGRATG